ncbi:DUF4296 domain-containing protein [Aestuariibaculum sediminum]|uniref:DUF4296 domain-containing protein n=1 Tax=Aestuariibaculum sediminum TaxID=2770637 RepID=A0A8J6U6T3_9FLAO|nr:DUF4296 domain-containing protein [Aestuariibaculum sediminum]MBD0830938.1 DUF4296 domain-containing protein [Aestuariibaculum sediminum]
MLKKLVTYFALSILFVACGNLDGPKKPDNLISKSKMVDIIIDARLVGSINGMNKRDLEDMGYNLKTYVFEKHGTDSLQFAQSNSYYAYHIKDYQSIFDKAIDSLERLKTVLEVEKQKEEQRKRAHEMDSIQHINKIRDSVINRQLEINERREAGTLAKPASSKDSLFL